MSKPSELLIGILYGKNLGSKNFGELVSNICLVKKTLAN